MTATEEKPKPRMLTPEQIAEWSAKMQPLDKYLETVTVSATAPANAPASVPSRNGIAQFHGTAGEASSGGGFVVRGAMGLLGGRWGG